MKEMIGGIILAVFIIALCTLMFGCHSQAVSKAITAPVAHPFAATDVTVKKLETPLRGIFVTALVVTGLAVGLMFTAFSAISKIALPAAGGVAAISFTGLIALPFLPWLILIIVLGVIGLLIYEFAIKKETPAQIVSGVASSTGGIKL